jgi:hypothetical protein
MKSWGLARRLAAVVMLTPIVCFAWQTTVIALDGAIFTTNTGGTTNENVYNKAQDVYLNGGPRQPGSAGLPNGEYYCQVTTPSGVLLGSSVWLPDPTPILVVNGGFQTNYQLIDIVRKQSNHSKAGFDDSPNMEYKVWVSADSSFSNKLSKTDNFKVRQGPPLPAQTEICAFKYYDFNQNQVWDEGEQAIPGWKFELRIGTTVVSTLFTDVDGKVQWLRNQDNTEYMVFEIMPEGDIYGAGEWCNTTPMCQTVIANGPTKVVYFGNVFMVLEPRYGYGVSKGGWHNQNGKAVLAACGDWWTDLNTLSLVWPNKTPFQITPVNGQLNNDIAHAQLAAWIVGVGALGEEKYILSTQYATLWLNVHCGPMSTLAGGLYIISYQYNGNVEGEFEEAEELLGDGDATDQDLLDLADLFDGVNKNDRPIYEEVPDDTPPDVMY